MTLLQRKRDLQFLSKNGFLNIQSFLEFLPKIEILRIFFNQDEIKELCKSITHNKKAIRCVWHMIFISTWYYVTFNNVKTDGNFFDIISS